MKAEPTKNITLRPVEEVDAEFVFQLRSDGTRNRFLSPVGEGVEAQRAWIATYKKREAKGEEYYFAICLPGGEPCGLVRVYAFQEDTFSWGSWVIAPGSPRYVAIESALAVYEFAFGELGLAGARFEVMKGNEGVLRFHRRFGAEYVGEDREQEFFTFSKIQYLETKMRYRRYFSQASQSE